MAKIMTVVTLAAAVDAVVVVVAVAVVAVVVCLELSLLVVADGVVGGSVDSSGLAVEVGVGVFVFVFALLLVVGAEEHDLRGLPLLLGFLWVLTQHVMDG